MATLPLPPSRSWRAGSEHARDHADLRAAGCSPAIHAVVCLGEPAADERGVARPQGESCDIGAFESTGTDVTPPVLTDHRRHRQIKP